MNKYLVIYDLNTGYTELGNAGIMFGNSEEDVKEKFVNMYKLVEEVKNKLEVTNLSEIKSDYMYYMR